MSVELFSAEDRDILSKSMGREPDDALLSRLLLTARQLASERYAEDMHVFRQKLAKYRSVLADYEAELAAWQKQAQVFDQRSRRYDAELAQWLSLPNRGDTPRPIPPVDPGPAPELPEPPAEPQEPNDRHSVDLLMAEQRAAIERSSRETITKPPSRDELQEQIDFIRWVMSGDEPVAPLPYNDEAEVDEPEEAPVVEAEPAPEPAPYEPNFTVIPDRLAKYAEADESAEDFRKRAFSLLFRFGIAEGENFEGGGEPLTAEEKIKLLPMLIANFEAGNWLRLSEELKPD